MIITGMALSESGKPHQGAMVYSVEGIGRTLMARDYKGAMLVEE